MTEAARFNTIATLTNLAALEENRMQMLHQPGLVDNCLQSRAQRTERCAQAMLDIGYYESIQW
jgi:hypothetical protein